MISLKKYLDMDVTRRNAQGEKDHELLPAMLELYCAALRAIKKSTVQVCPAVATDLAESLSNIETSLSNDFTSAQISQTEVRVAKEVDEWGMRTAAHFQAKANEVKELLIVLARTAESAGERDQRYKLQFNDLTTRLKAIANLDDLTEIRSSLMQRATELKTCLDQMSRDNQEAVAHLRAEVSTYQVKLKEAEQLASRDTLTALANRRSIEARIEWLILQKEPFCVVMLDLNGFKEINDTHGHAAGDDLLVQFARELETNLRSTDLIGRWGGDEFILVLACSEEGAQAHLDRLQKWVFGKYTIGAATDRTREVQIAASVGLAAWQPGQNLQALIKQADAAMYEQKQASRKRKR